MGAADDVAAQMAPAGDVQLIADAGGDPNSSNKQSQPLSMRQAIQRILFEATFWIKEYPPTAKTADAVDTVLGHAARAAGFGRAILVQVQSNAQTLQRIEAKIDALTKKNGS
jgi:hypothetical protein